MKKKLLSILLVATMLLAMIPAVTFATSAATTVTDWDAEEIVLMNADDFLAFRNQIRTKADAGSGYAFFGQTVKLGADINIGSIPKANGFDSRSFAGTFDGQNYTISGTIAQGGYQGALFGNVAATHPGAVIKNVRFENFTVTGGDRIAPFYGGVYGGTVTFENVYMKATVTSTAGASGQESGGFVGRVQSSNVIFKNCVFEGTVTNNAGAGAFVGCMMNNAATVSFENCLNKATNAMVAEKASDTTPTESYNYCINYTTDQAAIGEGFAAKTWLDANGYTAWTALSEGAPVPTTIAKAFFDAEMIDWDDEEIEITTAAQFAAFHGKLVSVEKNFDDQIVKLGADIDMTGYTLTPYADTSNGFYGTFDGQFHTVSNLKFSTGIAAYTGALFGALSEGKDAVIQNVGIVGATMTNYAYSGLFYGNVFGTATFENVYCNANITNSSGSQMGGYVGRLNLQGAAVSFENCVFDGAMSCSDYLYSPFVGIVEADATNALLTFTNCVIDGDFKRGSGEWAGAGKYISKNNSTTATVTYTDCIQYNDYYQGYTFDGAGKAHAVSPELVEIGSGFTAKTPAGFTARNTSYPVPTALLPFYASEINSARTLDGTTEYYAYQTTDAKDSVRFAGVVTGDATAIKAVGFEVVAIRENGNTWTNVVDGEAPIIQNVYTSILEAGTPKTAAECGGDYLFVYAVNDMVANKGVVTFAVKTFTVNTEGVKTYNDMCIVAYDTTLAA